MLLTTSFKNQYVDFKKNLGFGDQTLGPIKKYNYTGEFKAFYGEIGSFIGFLEVQIASKIGIFGQGFLKAIFKEQQNSVQISFSKSINFIHLF